MKPTYINSMRMGWLAGLLVIPAVAGADTFAWRSVAAVDSDPDANLVYSPFSLQMAFSMLYAGSTGESAAEMQELFGYADVADAPARASELIAALAAVDASDKLTLRLANGVWLQQGFPFAQGYLDTIAGSYQAEARVVNFSTAPEPARLDINDWVAQRTAQRIRDLLPAGSITDLTRLVLVNALYFKAPWKTPFQPGLTHAAEFHVDASETIEVRMMRGNVGARLLETDFADYLELPFLDPNVAMILVLPRQADPGNAALLWEQLAAGAVDLDSTDWPQHLVALRLPRFRVESTFDLKQPLEAMGVRRVFQPGNAGLDGIAPDVADLYVSKVAQKAFLEVIEEGAEAAAATAIVGGVTSVPVITRTLVFDRPFFAIIREKTTGSILFVSRVLRPQNPDAADPVGWEQKLREVLGEDLQEEEGWTLTPLGALHGERFPWVEHRAFGWLNLWGAYPLAWFWHPAGGWMWTDLAEGFPVVHDVRRDCWLRLYPEGDVHPWVYNYSTGGWETMEVEP